VLQFSDLLACLHYLGEILSPYRTTIHDESKDGLFDMAPREKLTVKRILKVNHAGEYGAIRIYRAQIWIARRLYPDVLRFLEETLEHEVEHCKLFKGAMPQRQARPCRIMSLWGNGGFVLGFMTALLGRQGIWICTEAVEATVHKHLDDQLYFLKTRDPELYALIDEIREEELSHLHHAQEQISSRGLWKRALGLLVVVATETVIWLSTWGDSTKMSKELLAAKSAL